MPQAYFPPLDRCLAGEERVISWKTAYRVLSDSENAIDVSYKQGDGMLSLFDGAKLS
jgi:hypothetical protein